MEEKLQKYFLEIFFLLFFLVFAINAFSAKIKDVSNILGVRDNQLIGYGLVVGLKGTGDSSSKFTAQSLSNLLKSVNVKIDPKDIKSKNVAAVIVTATLPPFSRQGDKINVVVSSIGDAKSLEGGTLLITPLKGVDGEIYALAQGSLTIGGFNGKSKRGQKNLTTVAKIPNGAIVERELVFSLNNMKTATLSLKKENFNLAINVQNAINKVFKNSAMALDPRTIRLTRPNNISMVEFLSKIQDIDVNLPKESPKIIIDERTGTVIAGSDIKIKSIVIAHADMIIKIKKDSNVLDLAQMLQKLGASPKDIISIFEAIKEGGAIDNELKII